MQSDDEATTEALEAIEAAEAIRVSQIPNALIFLKRRGSGWKIDRKDERDFAAHALFGAPSNVPREASLEQHFGTVRDQESTESCVGQAIAKAIRIRLAILGTLFEPSAMAIYSLARALETAPRPPGTPRPEIQDVGCFPRLGMKAIRDVGVAELAAWEFDPAKVNHRLPLHVIQSAIKFSVTEWWRIFSEGENRAVAVAQAIAKNYPVVFGIRLWEAFEDAKGEISEIVGTDRGGHMMTIVGYRTDSHGKKWFRVANSWGTTWADGGFAWMHEDLIALDRASDFYVIAVSP